MTRALSQGYLQLKTSRKAVKKPSTSVKKTKQHRDIVGRGNTSRVFDMGTLSETDLRRLPDTLKDDRKWQTFKIELESCLQSLSSWILKNAEVLHQPEWILGLTIPHGGEDDEAELQLRRGYLRLGYLTLDRRWHDLWSMVWERLKPQYEAAARLLRRPPFWEKTRDFGAVDWDDIQHYQELLQRLQMYEDDTLLQRSLANIASALQEWLQQQLLVTFGSRTPHIVQAFYHLQQKGYTHSCLGQIAPIISRQEGTSRWAFSLLEYLMFCQDINGFLDRFDVNAQRLQYRKIAQLNKIQEYGITLPTGPVALPKVYETQVEPLSQCLRIDQNVLRGFFGGPKNPPLTHAAQQQDFQPGEAFLYKDGGFHAASFLGADHETTTINAEYAGAPVQRSELWRWSLKGKD